MTSFKIEAKLDATAFIRTMGVAEKKIPQTTANALNIVAYRIRRTLNEMLPKVFDRPTAFTMNAIRVNEARPGGRPAALVTVRDSGIALGQHYLDPNIKGGGRKQKRFEFRLGDSSAFFVPSKAQQLDAYGNLPRGTYARVLSQLGKQGDTLSNQTARSAQRRQRKEIRQRGYASQYFQVKPGERLPPGIYERVKLGSLGTAIRPVLVQTRGTPAYRKRFPLYETIEREYFAQYPDALRKAINEALSS